MYKKIIIGMWMLFSYMQTLTSISYLSRQFQETLDTQVASWQELNLLIFVNVNFVVSPWHY